MPAHQMTPKRFSKLKIQPSPEAFLKAHWDWLSRREHSYLSPLLSAYRAAEITPTATIHALREALVSHDIRMQISKAEDHIAQVIERQRTVPKYSITIYCKFFNEETQQWDIKVGTDIIKHIDEDENGKAIHWEEEKELVFTAPLFQRAERICALRLAKRGDGLFGEIVNMYGTKIISTMKRDTALALVYPKDKALFTRNTTSHNKPFKNYPRTRNSRSVGPWLF